MVRLTQHSLRRTAARLGSHLPPPLHDRLRPAARRIGFAAHPGDWVHANAAPGAARCGDDDDGTVWCNICRWTGEQFLGEAHTESAAVPALRIDRPGPVPVLVLPAPPSRPGRRAGAGDQPPPRAVPTASSCARGSTTGPATSTSAPTPGDIQLDLQRIDLPDASLDVVLTPHVLEHVPDTAKALDELHPGDRQRGTHVPAGAARHRRHPGADRAGVPRRQHAGVLQLRLGPHRSVAGRRLRDPRPRPQPVPTGCKRGRRRRRATGTGSSSSR